MINVENLPPFHLGLVRLEMPLSRQIRDAKPAARAQLRQECTLVQLTLDVQVPPHFKDANVS